LCRLSNMFDGTGYEQCLADYSWLHITSLRDRQI
jgi:hypothetical protein